MKLKLEALSLRATLPVDSLTNEKLVEVCDKLSDAVRALQHVPDSLPLPAIVIPSMLKLGSLDVLIAPLNQDQDCFSLIHNFNSIQKRIASLLGQKPTLPEVTTASTSSTQIDSATESHSKSPQQYQAEDTLLVRQDSEKSHADSDDNRSSLSISASPNTAAFFPADIKTSSDVELNHSQTEQDELTRSQSPC